VEPIRRRRTGGTSSPATPAEDGSAGPPATRVYPPREDTLLLLPFAEVARGTLLLEVGTGSGVVALAAARHGARVVATDLNPYALRLAHAKARDEGLEVALVRTDLARGLGRFDRVLFNPPYLPTRPEERDLDPWENLALDGGPDGCRVAVRFLAQLPEHLTPGGEAFVVVSSRQDPDVLERTRRRWTARGGAVNAVATRALEGERLSVWRWTVSGN